MVLEYIGAAIGILGFIVGTVDRTCSTFNTAKQCPERLNLYHIRLRNAERLLKIWESRWCLLDERDGVRVATPAQLRYLWGSQGLSEVRRTQDHIETKAMEIVEMLRGPEILRRRPRRVLDTWQEMLVEQEQIQSDNPLCILFHHVALPLWKDSLLKASIESLELLVKAIESQSRSAYRSAHEAFKSDETLSNSEIQRSLVIQDRVDNLWRVMRAIHSQRGSQQAAWSLILQSLESPHEVTLDTDYDFPISFFYSTTWHGNRRGQRVDVIHELDGCDFDSAVRHMKEELRRYSREPALREAQPSGSCGPAFKDVFHSLRLKTTEKQREDRIHIRADCAKAALYIATWAIMLWGSRWFDNMCTCSIHYTQFDESSRVPVFRSESDHACPSTGDINIKLGLVLAEIALACPIVVSTEGNDLSFEIWDQATHARRVSRDQLLSTIRRTASPLYRDAVAYCLPPLKRPFKPPGQAADVVLLYTARVIKPLHDYCNSVDSFRKVHSTLHESSTEASLRILQGNYHEPSPSAER